MTYARISKIKTSRCRLVFAYEIKTCYLIQRYMAIIRGVEEKMIDKTVCFTGH